MAVSSQELPPPAALRRSAARADKRQAEGLGGCRQINSSISGADWSLMTERSTLNQCNAYDCGRRRSDGTPAGALWRRRHVLLSTLSPAYKRRLQDPSISNQPARSLARAAREPCPPPAFQRRPRAQMCAAESEHRPSHTLIAGRWCRGPPPPLPPLTRPTPSPPIVGRPHPAQALSVSHITLQVLYCMAGRASCASPA